MDVDVDAELGGLRTRDALVLVALETEPEEPREPGHKRRDAALLRVLGIRRSMRRLERRGYLAAGWSVDYLGAHCEFTERGRRVAQAAAAVLMAKDFAERPGYLRAWFGRLPSRPA